MAQYEDTLAMAQKLAIGGNYQEALTLIEGIDESIDVHLLKGKIFAQQQQFKEAIRQWEQVLAMDADHSEARRALALAIVMENSGIKHWVLYARLYYLVLIIVVVFSTILAGVFYYHVQKLERVVETQAREIRLLKQTPVEEHEAILDKEEQK